MKNKITNIFFLLSALAVSGCSKPTIHTPSFKSYGKLVDSEVFTSKYNVIAKPALLNFTDENGYYLPTNDYTIEYVLSGESTSSSKAEGDSVISSQVNGKLLIDNDNYRATYETNSKTFGKGSNVPEQYSSSNNTPMNTIQNDSDKFYYEFVGKTLYIANVSRQTIKTNEYYSSDLNRFTNYVVNSINYDGYTIPTSLFGYSSSNYYSYDYDSTTNTKYYINGSTFTSVTTEYNSSRTQETVTQVTFSEKALIAKAKTTYKYVSVSEKRDYVSYVDLSLKIGNVSISKLDYSEYTLIKTNY